MNIDELKKLISKGEGIDVEFKKSRNDITKDVYDSVCAFNNRNGGYIILGVEDNKEISGIDLDAIDKIQKDFTTAINNPQKLYPPLYLMPEIYEIEQGKSIIYIRVPEGGQVCRHNGRIWDRSYEGDIDITDNEELVYRLYARKQGSYYVNKIYPGLGIDFLDAELIYKAKKMALGRNANHPWAGMSEEEILRSVGLILTELDSQKEGITLAAILLFGKDTSIMSVIPQHKTDAIYRVENIDRYDDRDVIITNLLTSYERLINFGQKHLNDLFVLDGIQSVSARDRILREIVSNLLAHRDYSSAFPAKLIIEPDKIYTENSNMVHCFGVLDPSTFKPFPKNPPISRVFREIGLADELGSGMRNTYKYTKLYSGGIPIFDEENVFKITIPIKNIATLKVGPNKGYKEHSEKEVGLNAKIYTFCSSPKKMEEILTHCGYRDKKYFRNFVINPLLERGLINRTIPDKAQSSKQQYFTSDKGKKLIEICKRYEHIKTITEMKLMARESGVTQYEQYNLKDVETIDKYLTEVCVAFAGIDKKYPDVFKDNELAQLQQFKEKLDLYVKRLNAGLEKRESNAFWLNNEDALIEFSLKEVEKIYSFLGIREVDLNEIVDPPPSPPQVPPKYSPSTP